MTTEALRGGALAALLLAGTALPALAASFTPYTDRNDFNAAANPNLFENFNSFQAQTLAFDTAHAFNGFTVTGERQGASPYIGFGLTDITWADIDGTMRLQWGQDSFGGSRDGPLLTFLFDNPLLAIGFDWRNEDTTDAYQMTIGDTNFGAGTTAPWPRSRSTGFFGVVSDTPFTSMTLSQTVFGGVQNDMSMDNIAMNTTGETGVIPLPATLPLLGAGLMALLGLGIHRRNVG